MFTFPSLEWFQELARLMNENPEPFRRFGYADVKWALEIQAMTPEQTPCLFRFGFEAYSCTSVEELAPDAEPEVAFTMQATYDTWADMISNIQAHHGPDLDHSLNRLSLMDDPLYIAATDFLNRDLFARYGHTFQLFFNGAVHIPTRFAT